MNKSTEATMKLAKATKRDATKILDLCDSALNYAEADKLEDALAQIRVIAKRMDARTGTSDPSTKKKAR